MTVVVLDTNIVLDAFVFADEAARPLRPALENGSLQWLATAAMRDELDRVLAYPQIVPRLAYYGLQPADVLARFDQHAALVDAAGIGGVGEWRPTSPKSATGSYGTFRVDI